MNIPLETLFTAAMSAVGALLAAWVGTQLGLRKFRQERAFDARLDWHRKLAETAKVLLNRTRAFWAFRQGGTPVEVALPLVKELGQLAFTFQELAELASLYATKRTHTAVREAVKQMTKGAQIFATYPKDTTIVTEQQAQDMFTSSMSGIERVYNLLARDMRDMLGLEGLDEHRSLDTDTR
jgi:hypothetical protein